MKKPLSIAAVALALIAVGVVSFAPAAGAQTAPSSMTVDGVSLTQPLTGCIGFTVTGVRTGEVATSTTTISFCPPDPYVVVKFEACHRLLLLALSKPAQYRLGPVGPVGPVGNSCAVTLIAP